MEIFLTLCLFLLFGAFSIEINLWIQIFFRKKPWCYRVPLKLKNWIKNNKLGLPEVYGTYYEWPLLEYSDENRIVLLGCDTEDMIWYIIHRSAKSRFENDYSFTLNSASFFGSYIDKYVARTLQPLITLTMLREQ